MPVRCGNAVGIWQDRKVADMDLTSLGLDGGIARSVSHSLEQVEERLREAAIATTTLRTSAADPQMDLADDASRHLMVAGGKRVRPALTLLAAHLGDPDRPEVMEAAVAVELTHLASLYHDDVMDSADTRRGAPAAHALWGNNVAILTGDLLFARASRVMSRLGTEAVRIQADTFERLCLGQLRETVGPESGQDPVAHYLRVLADKTGSLIATSGRFGAMFAGCDEQTVSVMVDFGEKVGVAFQLADDVIDLSAQPSATGKNPGTDLREHVPTMPVLLARRAAEQGDAAAAAVIARIDGDLSDDDRLAETVVALRELSTTDQAHATARRWSEDAVAALALLPDGEVKEALTSFAGAVVDRSA